MNAPGLELGVPELEGRAGWPDAQQFGANSGRNLRGREFQGIRRGLRRSAGGAHGISRGDAQCTRLELSRAAEGFHAVFIFGR